MYIGKQIKKCIKNDPKKLQKIPMGQVPFPSVNPQGGSPLGSGSGGNLTNGFSSIQCLGDYLFTGCYKVSVIASRKAMKPFNSKKDYDYSIDENQI